MLLSRHYFKLSNFRCDISKKIYTNYIYCFNIKEITYYKNIIKIETSKK